MQPSSTGGGTASASGHLETPGPSIREQPPNQSLLYFSKAKGIQTSFSLRAVTQGQGCAGICGYIRMVPKQIRAGELTSDRGCQQAQHWATLTFSDQRTLPHH